MYFDLVPAIPHPGERASDGAGGVQESMSLGIKDQDAPGAVIVEGARGVDKPACAPAKGALRMVGERERERGEINAGRARRVRQEELLPRSLEGEHVKGLQQGEFHRAGLTAHVGLQRGEGFALPLEEKAAQGGIGDPGKGAGGRAIAIGIDDPTDLGRGVVADKVS